MIAAALLVLNTTVSTLTVVTGLSRAPLGILGDLTLVEVGLLITLGGFLGFWRSKGAHKFRRSPPGDQEEDFSSAKRREASKNPIAFFSAALLLFSFLIVLALLE